MQTTCLRGAERLRGQGWGGPASGPRRRPEPVWFPCTADSSDSRVFFLTPRARARSRTRAPSRELQRSGAGADFLHACLLEAGSQGDPTSPHSPYPMRQLCPLLQRLGPGGGAWRSHVPKAGPCPPRTLGWLAVRRPVRSHAPSFLLAREVSHAVSSCVWGSIIF